MGPLRGAVERRLTRAESGNPKVDFDPEVAESEARNGHRNAALALALALALAHFIASCGNMGIWRTRSIGSSSTTSGSAHSP